MVRHLKREWKLDACKVLAVLVVWCGVCVVLAVLIGVGGLHVWCPFAVPMERSDR
jgi:hypothetical protein